MDLLVLIVRPEDDNEPFERDIFIQHRNTGNCKIFLNILHVICHFFSFLEYFVGPSGGKRFYLRLLLSFDTFDGVLYDSFKSAYIARGLLDSQGSLIDRSSSMAKWFAIEGIIYLYSTSLSSCKLSIIHHKTWSNCLSMHQAFSSQGACSISLSQRQHASPFSKHVYE